MCTHRSQCKRQMQLNRSSEPRSQVSRRCPGRRRIASRARTSSSKPHPRACSSRWHRMLRTHHRARSGCHFEAKIGVYLVRQNARSPGWRTTEVVAGEGSCAASLLPPCSLPAASLRPPCSPPSVRPCSACGPESRMPRKPLIDKDYRRQIWYERGFWTRFFCGFSLTAGRAGCRDHRLMRALRSVMARRRRGSLVQPEWAAFRGGGLRLSEPPAGDWRAGRDIAIKMAWSTLSSRPSTSSRHIRAGR
jgi:hypothetical protein